MNTCKNPDKIYVREYPDGINQLWDRKKRDDVVAVIYHAYIRKDALLEWVKEQASFTEKLNGRGAMMKAWDSLIDKIESL